LSARPKKRILMRENARRKVAAAWLGRQAETRGISSTPTGRRKK